MMAARSPASNDTRGFGPINYVKITIFGFALAALWNSLHSIVLPLRLLDFVAEAEKNTYLGYISAAGLLLAMVTQPIAGAFSDRSGLRWGRRRPYILGGAAVAVLLISGIGFAADYVTVFAIYCLLQVSCNVAQAPYQGFIPDLVPADRRGLASGVKSLLEIVGGVSLVRLIALFMEHYSTGGGAHWLWLSLGILAAILLGTMLATVLTVRERPAAGGSRQPLLPTLYQSFRIDVRANRAFIWFLVSRLLVLMAFAILQRFALYFIRDVVGIASPAAVTGDLLIVVGICMLAAVYPAGRLSDRTGRRPIAIFSGLFGALGIAVLFLADSYGVVILAGGILGIASGAFLSTGWALATDLVASGEEARYLGLANLAGTGGSALVLLTVGRLIDLFNTYDPNLGYSVMLLICFIYFVVGSLLLLKVTDWSQLK
ncbi:MAG TPA: SLC45 family MFS transporter [Dehalococcoidia bacterium]|nr:SLC45 family MFS transporter [Dehalococcoidia bacterium]